MNQRLVLFMSVIWMLTGCSDPRAESKPTVARQPDCVADPFNYDFYSHADQERLTYCYAVLQTIAKQKESH